MIRYDSEELDIVNLLSPTARLVFILVLLVVLFVVISSFY